MVPGSVVDGPRHRAGVGLPFFSLAFGVKVATRPLLESFTLAPSFDFLP